jgi:hypothetical protein
VLRRPEQLHDLALAPVLLHADPANVTRDRAASRKFR